MEDDNTVLITKKRLAELEYDSRLLDMILNGGNRWSVDEALAIAKEQLTYEDINNGEYDKKD